MTDPTGGLGTRPEFARSFRLRLPDEPDTLHGVQFPSGRCVLDHPSRGIWYASTTFEHMTEAIDLSAAEIEWADGGTA